MRKILTKLANQYFVNPSDAAAQEAAQFIDLKHNHPGWQFIEHSMGWLQMNIMREMLSDDFTNQDAQEKDIEQRAYKMAYEIVEYILDPIKYAKTALKIRELNSKIESIYGKRPDQEATRKT